MAQYAGRIHRESDGKDRVTIYGCIDCSLPMLRRTINKRELSCKAMDYKISLMVKRPNITEFLLEVKNRVQKLSRKTKPTLAY